MAMAYYVRHTKSQGGSTYVVLPPQLIESAQLTCPGTIVEFSPLPGCVLLMSARMQPTYSGCFTSCANFQSRVDIHRAGMLSRCGPAHVQTVGECIMCGRVVLCNDVSGLNFCLSCTDSWVTLSYLIRLGQESGSEGLDAEA